MARARLGVDLRGIKPRAAGSRANASTGRSGNTTSQVRSGSSLMSVLCASGWLRRGRESRAVEVLPKGRRVLRAQLGVDVDHIV